VDEPRIRFETVLSCGSRKRETSVKVNMMKPPYDRNMTVNHTFRENPVESSQVYVE
jgi:hypothetical protein